MNYFKKTLCLLCATLVAFVLSDPTQARARVANAQDDDEPTLARSSSADSSALVRQLTSRNAQERQRAAEELAHLAPVEHRRLVEGYRLQEKNSRVQVALDWALYRMGKRESLYSLVRALDSDRSDQAVVYLSALETPDALYNFLERTNGHTQIKLLQVLAHVGDASTLERIEPHTRSLDPKLAEAARSAAQDISQRLASTPAKP
jgi:predicted DCC family thiol-disulfide oxidoreductase YuxK